jgi:hypothetical protein
MLLVRTRVAPSPIHGLGLYALDLIPSGIAVWRFTPGFDLDFDPDLIFAQPELPRQALLHYGYVDPRLNRYILCCDDARFINHSETPNIAARFAEDPYGLDVALHDIAPGEEITIDYSLVDGSQPSSELA